MVFIAVYVDDIIITSNDPEQISNIKTHLHQSFSIKDLGMLNYFLGIVVSYTNSGIVLYQKKFTKYLLTQSGFQAFKKVVTPLPSNLELSTLEGKPLEDPTQYKSMVGKLNFLTNTRLDLSFTVQTLSLILRTTNRSLILLLNKIEAMLSFCLLVKKNESSLNPLVMPYICFTHVY